MYKIYILKLHKNCLDLLCFNFDVTALLYTFTLCYYTSKDYIIHKGNITHTLRILKIISALLTSLA